MVTRCGGKVETHRSPEHAKRSGCYRSMSEHRGDCSDQLSKHNQCEPDLTPAYTGCGQKHRQNLQFLRNSLVFHCEILHNYSQGLPALTAQIIVTILLTVSNNELIKVTLSCQRHYRGTVSSMRAF